MFPFPPKSSFTSPLPLSTSPSPSQISPPQFPSSNPPTFSPTLSTSKQNPPPNNSPLPFLPPTSNYLPYLLLILPFFSKKKLHLSVLLERRHVRWKGVVVGGVGGGKKSCFGCCRIHLSNNSFV